MNCKLVVSTLWREKQNLKFQRFWSWNKCCQFFDETFLRRFLVKFVRYFLLMIFLIIYKEINILWMTRLLKKLMRNWIIVQVLIDVGQKLVLARCLQSSKRKKKFYRKKLQTSRTLFQYKPVRGSSNITYLKFQKSKWNLINYHVLHLISPTSPSFSSSLSGSSETFSMNKVF